MKLMAVAAIGAALMLGACEQQTGPGADAAHERHENFEALGKAFKTLGDQAKKPAPDEAIMKAQAVMIADLAEDLPNWFPAGSGPQDGIKTDALEKIWAEPVEFQAKVMDFQTKAAALRVASVGGVEAMKPAVGALGGACGGCHKEFRKK